jgi:hypothetical protein
VVRCQQRHHTIQQQLNNALLIIMIHPVFIEWWRDSNAKLLLKHGQAND